jgi:hypothetical protein
MITVNEIEEAFIRTVKARLPGQPVSVKHVVIWRNTVTVRLKVDALVVNTTEITIERNRHDSHAS